MMSRLYTKAKRSRTIFKSSIKQFIHRDNFRKYLFFSSRSTFSELFQEALYVFTQKILIYSRKIYFSSNRYHFFQEGLSVHRTDTNYSRISFFGYRTDTDFPGALFWLPNRYDFPGSLFQISSKISRKVPPPNFSIRSRWLLLVY